MSKFDITPVPLSELYPDPNNARRTCRGVDALAASIESQGLLQNLVVTRRPAGGYFVLSGNRRLLALQALNRQAQEAGRSAPWSLVPCRKCDEPPTQLALGALSENVARSSLTPWEIGVAIVRLMRRGARQEEIRAYCGKSQSWVALHAQIGRGLHEETLALLDQLDGTLIQFRDTLALANLKDAYGSPDAEAQREWLSRLSNRNKRERRSGLRTKRLAAKTMKRRLEFVRTHPTLQAEFTGEQIAALEALVRYVLGESPCLSLL